MPIFRLLTHSDRYHAKPEVVYDDSTTMTEKLMAFKKAVEIGAPGGKDKDICAKFHAAGKKHLVE